MTQYYPYLGRSSLLENCLFNAFKDEYNVQKIELQEKMINANVYNEFKPFSFESFKLSQGNQNFKIEKNELFTESTLLFKKMYETNKKSVGMIDNRDSIKLQTNGKQFTVDAFDVMQIDERMSYFDAVKFAHSLYLSSPELLYGVLLHDGSKFINPLHPINAQAIVKKHSLESNKNSIYIFEEKKFKIIIYTFKESFDDDQNFYKDKTCDELFTNHIFGILAMMNIERKTTFKITKILDQKDIYGNIDMNQAGHFSKLVYNYSEINENSDNTDYYIQPVQLINTGIAIPYYGIVAQKCVNGSTSSSGYQLSPMLSCNLGFPYTRIYKKNEEIEVYSVNVCTGSYTNNSENGRLSLNHANLGSPYFKTVLNHSSFAFANICVKISLGIYAEFLGLESIGPMQIEAPKAQISFATFRFENPTATLNDYLKTLSTSKIISELI